MLNKYKIILIGAAIICSSLSVSSCNTNNNDLTPKLSQTNTKDPLIEARDSVIKKWKNDSSKIGTTKFIEDIYNKYSDDEVIANIYFYSTAKEEYDLYKSLEDEKYLKYAIEYANKIDPSYSGEFSSEMQEFADSILGENRKEAYSNSIAEQERYNSLTDTDKKEICNYIQSRYDYYDSISNGKKAQYSDTIWKEAAEKYELSESHISIIWMNMYNY